MRFLSCEPLLGSLNIDLTNIDWVIVGGESGQKHRPMKIEWAEEIRDSYGALRYQCQKAEVAFFFKQIGGRTSKAGGKLLDGRIWDEMPEAWQEHQKKWGQSPRKLALKKENLQLTA